MENDASETSQSYTVVARRYRPRAFDELIGQDHVSQALGRAIETGRVGHAYLFTGARGVGKTSTARIFAKVLNTQSGTEEGLSADIAEAIDSGGDMDVIEIDGASNRGIEEIRQLRANVNVRPSRARFKIYIIDEVHMLTNQAFNALLKTLEEPPEHVKFIFCTTDPDKIPITVLSRCQRFDFAPVKFEAIQKRLSEICQAEGYEAEDEALGLLARRAAGSMRDSQSLLEQVMSFSTDCITVRQVHELLGTADEGRLLALAEAMRDADALAALQQVEDATQAGSDPGQLAEQLLNYLRDIMAVGIGGGPDLLKIANPVGHNQLTELASSWGVQTILSAIQLLDESLVRMRTSVSATTLLEVALVQICQLEKIASIPAMLEVLRSGASQSATPTSEKKNKLDERRLPSGGATPSPNRQPAVGTSPAPEDSNQTLAPAESAVEPPTSPSHSSPSHSSPSHSSPSHSSPSHSSPSHSSPSHSSPSHSSPSHFGASGASPQKPPLTDREVKRENLAPESATQFSAASTVATPIAAEQKVDAPTPTSSPRETEKHIANPATVAPKPVADVSAATRGAPQASADALGVWLAAVGKINGMLADFAALAEAVEPLGAESWKIVFPPGNHRPCEYCEQAERRAQLQAAVGEALGRGINLTFAVKPGEAPKRVAAAPQSTLRVQKMREVSENPYVKKVCEVLGGEIIRVDAARVTPPPANSAGQTSSQSSGQ